MSLDSPPARRRWFRFTIGKLMIASPVIALAIIFIAGIDPFRRDPMQQALEEATRFCAIPTFTFDESYRYDSSKPKLKSTIDKPRLVDGPCVLKFDIGRHVISDGQSTHTYGTHGALAEDGRSQSWHNTTMGVGGGGGTQSPEQMAAINRILLTLPQSQTDIPAGPTKEGMWGTSTKPERRTESRILVIGFRLRGTWVTRAYDKKRLPPEVAALLLEAGYMVN